MNKKFSVYIHIPFCRSKCGYCDFYSLSGSDEYMHRYFEALIREIQTFSRENTKTVDSIYIGGGTPSYVPAEYIGRILDALRDGYNLSAGCEISMEANPGTLDKEKAAFYKEKKISRISLGVQSCSSRLLRVLGRTHTSEDVINSIAVLREAGISNINTDLMYALPSQTLDEWKDTLRIIAGLSPSHISAYALTIEEGTPFFSLYKDEEFDDELDREMYAYVTGELAAHGYRRYEISNFAKNGFECRHNLYCWQLEEYRGFGAAAHSFCGRTRFSSCADINEYILQTEAYGSAAADIQQLSEDDLVSDYCILALRTSSGISFEDYQNSFGHDFFDRFGSSADKLTGDGLLTVSSSHAVLSSKGFDFANAAMREFLL